MKKILLILLFPLTSFGQLIISGGSAGGGSGDALTSGTLAQFASTTSLELKGVISDESGSGALVFGTSPTLTTPTIAAGGTSRAPFRLTSGTVATSATAGDVEYDGKAFYSTHATSERGVIPSQQWISLTSNYTLTSQTAAQQIFNSTTNGRVTVAANTTYHFVCQFALASMSATSGSYGFAIGGTATLSSQTWNSQATKTAFISTAANAIWQWNTAANTALTASNTTQQGSARIEGIFRVTTGGTIIPQVSLGVAAAAIVQAGSYFWLEPVGSDTATSVGNWD